MKLASSLIIALFIGLSASAQKSYNLPMNYKMDKKEDYAKYEQDVIDATEWLVATKTDSAQVKRALINKFILKWVNGSPTVTVILDYKLMGFFTSNHYMPIFMGAWSAEHITNKNYKDKVAGNMAGIEAVIKYYQANEGILKKDKLIEKLIKLKKKGKLKDYVIKQVAKQS